MLSKIFFFQILCVLNYHLVAGSSENAKLNDDDPVLVLHQGIIRGAVSTSIDGVQYFRFQGIPYAKPPVNELRFKAPVPLERWNGILQATDNGAGCAGSGIGILGETLVEDCLFLNVYTKQLGGVLDLKPVLIWIHGGSFITGSGSSQRYSPDFFMNEDVVIVTINYRLDLFGYLAFSDDSSYPGNAGFKDMVLALKWVQTNINKFGGDPRRVTIFGESAGSKSVHLLLMSPLAKGLFHRAIAQSGTSISSSKANFSTQDLASYLGLKNSTKETVLRELSLKTTKEINEISRNITAHLSGESRMVGFTIEKNSSEAFIIEDPIQSILKGNFNQVPFIIGFNNYEALAFEIFNTTFPVGTVPEYFGYTENSTEFEAASKKLRDFYNSDNDELDQINLQTDKLFVFETFFSARHQVKTSKEPVYLYRFAADSSLNLLKNMYNKFNHKGACHGDDTGYLFKSDVTPTIKPGSVEDISRRRMVRLWSNFAKFGNPTPVKDTLLNATWTPVRNNTINILSIDEQSLTLLNQDYPEKERVAFWDQLFKESPTGRQIPDAI